MTSEHYRLIVIGGGISGLSLAHYACRHEAPVLVLEAGETTGGCLCSPLFPGYEDFWCELGAHTLYNSYGHLLGIMEDLGLLGSIQPKLRLPYRLWIGDRPVSVPSRLHWLELMFSLPKLFFLSKAGKSVQGYYAEIAGRKNFQEVLGPAFDAVICQPAADFPAEALFRKRARRKEILRSFTLPGGVQDIAAAISGQPGIKVKTQAQVERIARVGQGFRVITASGQGFTSEDLVVATPPAEASALLSTVFPDLSGLLAQIQPVYVDSLAVVLPARESTLPPVAGLIGIQDAFYSVVSRDPRPDERWRGFTFHFRPDRFDAESKAQRIASVLGLKGTQPLAKASRRNPLPALRQGHAELVARLQQQLSGQRLGLTGNYFQGVAIEDCISRSRSEYERLYPGH